MKKVYSIFVCLCMLAGFVACDKDKDFALTTLAVTNETVTPSYETAEVSCNFKADATISEAYVQYSLSSSFADYEVAKMTEEKGIYTALLTGLVDNTTYYIRYTVSNKFSNVVADAVEEFQTLSCTVPTIVLDSIGGVRESHAKAYLHLIFDGGASVTDMGICWSTEASSTIEDIHKSTKDTAAVLDITNLQENTKYYVRAYAVNRVGTAYSEEQVFTTESVFSEPTGTENGYGYVDLGLSVKWATMNVGASSPEEYGNYYAWGETTAKNTYTWNTYKYCNGSETTLTKYNTSTMAGTVDNKTTLELSDDAAYINWDGNWRMPSEAEWEELREQCTWIWTTKNGVKGHKVTSKINDNNIFLPASGRRFVDALTGVGMDGNYWSNTLNVASPCEAMYVLFISNGASSFGSDRYIGHSVRPVLGEKVVESTTPIVATTVVTQITATTAIVGGNVTGDGGASVTERGVVYSTNPNPVITNLSNTIRPCGSGMGEFTYTITGLQPSTKYYVRAYAKNDAGTAYGEEVSFTTLSQQPTTQLPTVTTSVATQITATTAVAGGNVTSEGGASVTERGVCIATISNPTTANTKIPAGSGTGEFTCEITGLQEGTKYYIRAYAVNSEGTAYGDEEEFTTAVVTTPTLTTSEVTQITETSAVAGGNVTSDGNASVTERGVVYSLSANPAITDLSSTIVRSGNGTGAFTCNLSNLQAGTTYYVRAYAINSKGTAYGDEISFTTALPITLATVTTASITQITETTAVAGGNVTNDGNASVTERGVCIATVSNPTTAHTKISAGSSIGMFTCNLKDLQPNTKYYVRAYAVNEKGTAYGEEVTFITLEEVSISNPTGTENGYGYVDLGLSVKWATYNVGANKPEEYGDYFAWGEIDSKNEYYWTNYKWCNGSETTITKYNNSSSYGIVDNKTQLELCDDAARANWGGNWRIPTDAEWTELREQCIWTWTTYNGVKGYVVTNNSSNHSIFLPAAGYQEKNSFNSEGVHGHYWSRSLNTDCPHNAWRIYFGYSGCFRGNIGRYYGFTVRSVLGENKVEITVPTVITATITQITETSAVAGGNVTIDGGAEVTERGVVYSTNPNPVITNLSNTIRPCGSGMGEFTYTITGLQPSTKYYVRAYAKNDAGTAYGEEVSFTTEEQSSIPNNGTENGHEYVDLGLSVKWATMNVGASSPEDYGDYFAWGETSTKSTYDWSTYTLCKGSASTLTKYNTNSICGTVDNKTTLELSDDAAHVNWGGSWRMPTDAEMTELINNCYWSWSTQNGGGYRVTSKSNGNSIFLPAAGYYWSSSLYDAGRYGYYWSSSLSTESPDGAHGYGFNSSRVDWGSSSRDCGFSVRPVCP